MRSLYLTIAAVTVAASSAFASTPGARGTRTAAPQAPVTVDIQNNRPMSVVLYAQRDNQEVRIGRVAAHGSAVVEVPRWLVFDRPHINFFVHPESGFDANTGDVRVSPGERIGILVATR
jgi:hypothetical protein